MDFRELVRLIQDLLDYLGFDLFRLPIPVHRPIMSTPHQHIRTRSIIRKIGTACKFIQSQQMHIQPHLIGDYDSFNSSTNCVGSCPNMGDIRWIMEDHHNSYLRLRCDINMKAARQLDVTGSKHSLTLLHRTKENIFTDLDEFTCSTPDLTMCRSVGAAADLTAMDKISALEEELGKLREMLANIATVGRPPDVIPTTVPPPPLLVPPPPPPPPPPPISLPSNSAKSIADIVNERRKKNGKSGIGTAPASGHMPSMTDVLKDLGTVKLKCISRSPGGTPLPKHPKRPLPADSMTDPQAIIAAALKKKFAHLAFCSSPEAKSDKHRTSYGEDKENSFNSSCGNSPAKAEFGQHLLKTRRPTGSPLAALNT